MSEKYTEEQKARAIKKLARAYGKWNKIEDNDDSTRSSRTYAMHQAAFSVIKKFGGMNEYYLATRDCRGRK